MRENIFSFNLNFYLRVWSHRHIHSSLGYKCMLSLFTLFLKTLAKCIKDSSTLLHEWNVHYFDCWVVFHCIEVIQIVYSLIYWRKLLWMRLRCVANENIVLLWPISLYNIYHTDKIFFLRLIYHFLLFLIYPSGWLIWTFWS